MHADGDQASGAVEEAAVDEEVADEFGDAFRPPAGAVDIGVYRPKHTGKFEGGISIREIDLEQRNVAVEVAEAMREARKPTGK